MVWFEDKVAHIFIRESESKSMRAETFVLCNTQFMIKLMIDLKVTPPLLRASTNLFAKDAAELKGLLCLNGPSTDIIRGGEAVVGRSRKFDNLYYMFGMSSANLAYRKQAAILLS